MASEVSICNKALRIIRAERISAMDEVSETAEWCRDVYEDTRDALIAEYPWNFATRRASLAANSTAPAFGFAYAYDLPADPLRCLRVLSLDGEPEENRGPWKVEGNQLLTDEEGPLNILYLARITDAGAFPPLFVEALAARLAVEGAWRFTGSGGREASLVEMATMRTQEARRADAQEGTSETMVADDWLRSRF